VASSTVGSYLLDGSGHALYIFGADTSGHSNCTGSCLTYWPIDPAPATLPARSAGVTVTLGTLARPDGAKQLTIDGLPVYTYSGDTSPGMTAGQGVSAYGALWWLVTPTGHALTSASSPTATSSGHKY
jgi:predicted lipoprotein with Yx(FWY)xxD motif